MASVGVNVIETAALGRPFQLGMLYDCRRDALIPGITLWDPEKIQQSLQVRPKINTVFKVPSLDSIEDKSNLLNIDGSLKLSVLGGLVNVTGAAKYLNDTKKSFKQQRLTLHYHSTSRFEELTMKHLASENIVNREVLDNDTATHVVTAVLYGADACFVFDREVSSDEEIKKVKGEAKMAFEKLRGISLDAKISLKMNDTQKYAVRKFTCTFYGDFQLPSNPTSFEDALKVFSDLPKLLGERKELAVPLRVWLYPLDKIHTRASKLQRDISMDLIMAIESVIESLNTTEMKCNDLLKDSPASTFAEFHDRILQMKQNCYKYKLRLVKKLGSLLPNIRGDVMKESDLNDLLQEHDESPFRGIDLAEWLKERERESDIIKPVLRQLKDAGAQAEVNIDAIWMDLEVGNLVCYTFTSLNWSDVLLLQQKAHLNPSTKGKNENIPDSEQKSWLTPEIQNTLKNNLMIFKNLIDSNNHKLAKFIVSSKEMKNNPGSCILLYEHGHYEAVCFIPPSKPACPITEEVKDNSVVLKVPPPCPATVELRILYKQKKGILWTSKPVMKDELTVTLTDLREETEYEIKCAALGKLNYTVYSDVISITTEGKSSLIIVTDIKAEDHSLPGTTSGPQCFYPNSCSTEVTSSSEEQLDEIKSPQSEEIPPVVKTYGEHELRSLRSNPSHLRELDLSGKTLGDSGVKLLSGLLEDPKCKLEKLGLRSCQISDEGCAVLRSALRSNPSHLRELDLSENDIKDSGLIQLSDLLEHPQCKLEKLELRSCHISDRGYAVLSSTLRSNSSLRELDLSGNDISELGVKMFSALLADPQCKLEKLRLRSCQISDGGYAVLSSALRSNPSLRELDLSENKITDYGMTQLSALLADAQCKLEKLVLRSCNISSCYALSSALRSNPSLLRELDLSENNITYSGVPQLSSLLKQPQCKLEKLRLRSCHVRDDGCAHLTSALTSNPSHLRELDLSGNDITCSGLKQLSDLLKNPQCKLEKLELRSCYISNRGCADLRSALRSNPSHLRELDLSGNAITDSEIKQLSALLEDPQCKLEKLGQSQDEIL